MPKHAIRLLHIVPLHDLVTLTIFEDDTVGIIDCKLLVNHHKELTTSYISRMSGDAEGGYLNLQSELEEEIGQSDYKECPNGVSVSVEIEDRFHAALMTWCEDHRITVEKMMLALMRFVTKENEFVIQKWINDFEREQMSKALKVAEANEITEDDLKADFDGILEKVENGLSPVSILCNNGKRLIMFEWEDYWKRIGWFSGKDRAAIEQECRNAQDTR